MIIFLFVFILRVVNILVDVPPLCEVLCVLWPERVEGPGEVLELHLQGRLRLLLAKHRVPGGGGPGDGCGGGVGVGGVGGQGDAI